MIMMMMIMSRRMMIMISLWKLLLLILLLIPNNWNIVKAQQTTHHQQEQQQQQQQFMMFFNNEFIQVWFTRILVTIGIIIIWEFIISGNRTITMNSFSSLLSSSSSSSSCQQEGQEAFLQYDELQYNNNDVTDTDDTTATIKHKGSRLLNEFEKANIDEIKNTDNDGDDDDDDDDDDDENNNKDDDDNNEKKQDTTTKEKAKKKKSKSNNNTNSTPTTTTTTTTTTPSPSPPLIKAKTNHHPGMEGFAYWYEIETSLYRIYTLGRNDNVQVVPPYVPHSYRGTVSIEIHVTNQTMIPINVYWVNYKGQHILKGSMLKPNISWVQTTYIDHPWVFENATTNEPLLYYIPYRVIPTLPDVPTITNDGNIGLHKFIIKKSKKSSSSSPYYISIEDNVLPYPGIEEFHTPLPAYMWTFQHMSRMTCTGSGGIQASILSISEIDTILKYLTNIMNHPNNTKYRQLRISSKRFQPIWNSPLRGLLLALGFVEVGPYAELGCSNKPLSPERIQDVALLTYLITQWKNKELQDGTVITTQEQPAGADGFGRQGYGRVGGNF